jgi:flagellar hook-associated protein 2
VDETPANLATGEPNYKNLLKLDSIALTNALNSNFENVRKQLEFDLASDSTNFRVYTHGSKITSGVVAYDIDIGRPSADIVRATYNGSTIPMTFIPDNPLNLTQGGSIKGTAGSFMDGYEFFYTGTGVETFNITISQGVADKLFNTISQAIDIDLVSGTSILQTAIISLVQENYDKNRLITEKLRAVEVYKESLIQKYSRMEANLTKANMMLTFLETQLKVMEKS